jgi:hypothetical protein
MSQRPVIIAVERGRPWVERPMVGGQVLANERAGAGNSQGLLLRSLRSIDLRVEEFPRTCGIDVGLCDKVGASIDIGRHVLAL